MAKTETVYTRVEPELKENAEKILSCLGMTPSEAITVFLNQVVLHKGLPFAVKLPDIGTEDAKAILMQQLRLGEDSAKSEGWLTVEESKLLLGVTR